MQPVLLHFCVTNHFKSDSKMYNSFGICHFFILKIICFHFGRKWNNRPSTSIFKNIDSFTLSWFLSSFLKLGGGGMVFNATFNNISAINIVAVSLLVEETAIPGENHRPVASHRQTSSLNVVVSTPRLAWFELTLVAIGTDCTDRYKSNYDAIILNWEFMFSPFYTLGIPRNLSFFQMCLCIFC